MSMGSRASPFRWVALIAAVYLMAILLVKNQYYQLMMTLVPVWATMGLSWNILSGYSGLVSFGHASFFGLGAYTVALSLINFGLTRSEEHTSELQSRENLVCRLLLEKKKKKTKKKKIRKKTIKQKKKR